MKNTLLQCEKGLVKMGKDSHYKQIFILLWRQQHATVVC